MAKDTKKVRLGLSFGAEELFLIQTEEAANRYRVTEAADVTSSIPFSIDLIAESSGAEMIGNELKNLVGEKGIIATELAVSLDLHLGIIIKIPFDRKLSDKELKTHLKWELQQYIDEDVVDYSFDSYKLIQSPSMKQPELILVGARTKVVDFFREVCDTAELDLSLINLDIISAVNSFEANYKFDPSEKIALVEIGEQKLVFTLLEGNFFIGHHTLFLDDIGSDAYNDTVLDVISMNLKTLFSDYELGKSKSNFDHVFLYRSNSKYSVTQLVESSGENTYSIFNPFENIRLDDDVRAQIEDSDDHSEFVEAVGLTLRNH